MEVHVNMGCDNAGDASFVDGFTEEELEKLIRCENDDDYTFMLRQLCNDGLLPTGPYFAEGDECGKSEWQRSNLERPTYSLPTDYWKYD